MTKNLIFCLLMLLAACDFEQERLSQAPLPLTFSADTVLFDTIFTQMRQLTKRLTVRNPNPNAVVVEYVGVASLEKSPYSLIINGEKVQEKKDLILLGKDSLLILVNVNLDAKNQDLPFIVKDSILFRTKASQQKVLLLAWGQDAHFLNNTIIKKNTIWKNDKPYVIYNGVLVDSLVSLEVEAGTKIYMDNSADFYVKGTLQLKGTAQKPISISSTRQDAAYKRAFGQWGGIYFLEGSKNNLVSFTHISNGIFGLRVGTPDDDNEPDLVVRNSRIENMLHYGLVAFTSDVLAENCLFYNCIRGTAAGFLGGNYVFRHCTFVNLNEFFREQTTFAFSNFIKIADNQFLEAPLKASLENCIIWGSLKEEVELAALPNTHFEVFFRNNLLKTERQNYPNGNILNQEPQFFKPEEQNFRPKSTSPVFGKGADLGISIDLEGRNRKNPPDIGAFEAQK